MIGWRRGLLAWMVMCGLSTVGTVGRVQAQAAAVTEALVRGAVVDASGAQVAGAQVHAEPVVPVRSAKQGGAGAGAHSDADPDADPGGRSRDVTADATGHFLLTLPGGTYTVTVQSPGFDPYVRENLKLDAGQHIDLPVKLLVASTAEVVNVPADASSSTDPADNKSALVFKGGQLDIFSDDDAVLQQQLTAMAGGDPSLPPQILIDGFSNGQFPPKSSIREIRINQNPYSAQYDQSGYGRVEIFTKPGSNTLHGNVYLSGNENALNARNPYVTGAQPSYHREHLFADVSGPLGKKTSFDLGTNVNDNVDNSPVNATVLDSSLNPLPVRSVVSSPSLSQNYTLRLDRQLGANDTVTVRYSLNRSSTTNGGIGTLTLSSQATDTSTEGQTLQAGDTHVIGTKTVAESRLQYSRTLLRNDPVSTAPTLIVQGAFNGGGAPGQALHDHQDRLELQEYLSFALKKHFIRTGARYRLTRDANLATGGFNGQYIFPDIGTYQRALADVRNGRTGAQIAAMGDGPSQFNVTAGEPSARVMTGDAGLYAEDDWKVRPDLTLSYGGRLESQSAIPDHLDLAPRLGASWAPLWGKRKTPLLTFRAGFGMFYDRFDSGNLLQTIRQNGTRERGYFLPNPETFGCAEGLAAGPACTPVLPMTASLTALQPSTYRLSPQLHSQYAMQGGLTGEHSFGGRGSIAVNWVRVRGVHQFEMRNVNAPLPGTYLVGDPASGTRPLGSTQNIYQYSSDGVRSSNQLRTYMNLRPTRRTFLFASYSIAERKADTSGAGSLPSNQYNLAQDYGPSSNTSGRELYCGGGGGLPWGLQANVFIATQSPRRFNITTGQDLNGDTSYNDRPAFATDLTRASVVRTRFGNFDTLPMPGQTLLPINYAPRPGLVYTEVGFGREFSFGSPRAEARKAAAEAKPALGKPKPEPEKPYHLNLSTEIDNVLNHTNPGPPVGVLTSPYFGQSISLSSAFGSNGAANRTVTLQMNLEF